MTFLPVYSAVQTLMRYLLGITMMGYGLIKICQIQFALPPEVYEYQLKQLDGVTLAWAFLGFSSWFVFLLGTFELVPGFLLLFKKTQLLGAILAFPSLLAVFLVNNAYNFLPHMRILTAVLLFLNVILLSSAYRPVMAFLKQILGQSSTSLVEFVINTALLAVTIFLVVFYLM